MRTAGTQVNRLVVVTVVPAALWLLSVNSAVAQQRALGVDVSYWNRGSSSPSANGITQSAWNTAYNTADANGNTRQFAFVRASRGGTTGLSTGSGTPNNPPDTQTLSERYDDPEFLRTMTRATNAGFFAGPYHYGRPDVAGNTGTDEANHFIEYASAYMRPGYMMPVLDLEAGSGADTLAQFAIDISNRIYARMQIRPGIYVGGNFSSTLQGATQSRRDQLAKPSTSAPSVVGPAFPMLWNPRYAYQGDDLNPGIQTANPKDTASTFYGPWDDYGGTHPWSFWQYSSTSCVPGLCNVDATIDSNVSHGDIEYVKNYLVPAVWWHDSSGDWGTMTNWNSGQPLSTFNPNDLNNPPAPYVPHAGEGQTTPFSSYTLPVPRLPGTAGSGPASTSGVHDTVILERPNANITVTHSTGTTNIRKLYMRETLNITGGSLTINYDPTYRPNTSSIVLHGGPISAQFSGAVTLSGTGSLNVHTLQVDSTQTFTLAGGTLTFNKINLMPHSTTPAKIAVSGNMIVNPLNGATATIANGSGGGSTGFLDLGGGTRTFDVGNGASDVDLSVNVPINNGGLTKNGAGTMLLAGANTFSGPVTVNAGVLRYGNASGLSSSSVVTVNNGGTLDMNNFSDSISALSSTAGHTTGVVSRGTASLTLTATSGTNTYNGTITGSGTFTKSGGATQVLTGNNTLGAVALNAGSLLFNGTNTTGAVTVASGATLGGTGSVSGAVTVNSGGHIAPGASIESLGVGPLTVQPGSVLDFEVGGLGGSSDRIDVAGLLTLNGGSINIIDAGGLDFTSYTLIDYGTLSGSVASLGTPTGPAGFKYSLVDTGSLIRLVVSPEGVPGDYNDDGIVDATDYAVWLKNVGQPAGTLPNDDTGVTIGTAQYDQWAQNFGNTSGAGAGNSTVPEPSSLILLMLALAALTGCRRGR